MQATPDKEYNELFRRKFEDFEIVPSDQTWKNILADLNEGGARKKAFPVFWLSIAASIICIVGAALIFSGPPEKIMLQGRTDQVAQVDSKLTDNESTVQSPEAGRVVSPVIDEVAVSKTAAPVAHTAAIASAKQPERVATQVQEIASTAMVAEAPAPVTSVAKEERTTYTARVAADQPVMSFASQSLTDADLSLQSGAQRRSKNGGGIVGNLVNYVVSKVDPRQDKIVELSADGDGGSEITGINLGFLKIKNRNK